MLTVPLTMKNELISNWYVNLHVIRKYAPRGFRSSQLWHKHSAKSRDIKITVYMKWSFTTMWENIKDLLNKTMWQSSRHETVSIRALLFLGMCGVMEKISSYSHTPKMAISGIFKLTSWHSVLYTTTVTTRL